MSLLELLKQAQERSAQLHICAGQPPLFWKAGQLVPAEGPRLSREDLRNLLEQARDWGLPAQGQKAVGIPGLGRCLVNVQLSWIVFRPLPSDLPEDPEKLNLPPVLAELSQLSSGLVLLGGPRGSGVRTSLASLLENLRQGEPRRLVLIGRCHDYVQGHGRGLLGQAPELTDSLLDSCDVVVLSVHDESSARQAVAASEEGRLVLALLRASHVPNMLDRLQCWLPPGPWTTRLSAALRGAYAQRLLASAEGPVPIHEFVHPEVCRRLLHNPKRAAYPDCLEKQAGSWSLLHSLQDWLDAGRVTPEEAERLVQTWT